MALEPPPTQAATASGSRPSGRGTARGPRRRCRGQVAHHARERVRAGRRAEEVGGVVDTGHPVAQRLVDRVLERGAAGGDRHDLGAEQLHPGDVQRLALGVDLAHVDGAVEAEVRRRGGRGHAVLAGAGLGDHPRLAHPLGQQGLAEHVADLVGAGVVEVLALEQERRADAARGAGGRRRAGSASGVLAQHRVELAPEGRVGLGVLPGGVELVERGDQRLGHEAAARTRRSSPARRGPTAGRSAARCGHRRDCRRQGLATAASGSPPYQASPTSTTRARGRRTRHVVGPVIPDSATITRRRGRGARAGRRRRGRPRGS